MADLLAQRIREAREAAGLTQEQFAPLLGISLRTLTRYESGETQRISTDMLLKVARVTGKTVGFFLAEATGAAA